MRQLLISAALGLAAAQPLQAEEESGTSLMERGARLFMEGIMKEVEPTVDELQGLLGEMEPALRSFAEKMGPALTDLMQEVEDWSAYHPPEILPNGDIILRKKRADEMLPPEDETNEALDL